MSGLSLTPDIRPKPTRHELGVVAGRNHAGNEDVLWAMALASIDCMLDETQPEADRQGSYDYLTGFCEGWREILMKVPKPYPFLTRQQTARVMSLPAKVRREWMQEYNRACYAWRERGGNVPGNRPELPEIP